MQWLAYRVTEEEAICLVGQVGLQHRLRLAGGLVHENEVVEDACDLSHQTRTGVGTI